MTEKELNRTLSTFLSALSDKANRQYTTSNQFNDSPLTLFLQIETELGEGQKAEAEAVRRTETAAVTFMVCFFQLRCDVRCSFS